MFCSFILSLNTFCIQTAFHIQVINEQVLSIFIFEYVFCATCAKFSLLGWIQCSWVEFHFWCRQEIVDTLFAFQCACDDAFYIWLINYLELNMLLYASCFVIGFNKCPFLYRGRDLWVLHIVMQDSCTPLVLMLCLSFLCAGEFLSFETAYWCQDKGLREAGKGFEADQGRDSYVEHWVHVIWCSSSCCEEWFGKTTTYFSSLHQQGWEDRIESPSGEALASHWVGYDSSRNHHRSPTLPPLSVFKQVDS
jgi:hypothetical protein